MSASAVFVLDLKGKVRPEPGAHVRALSEFLGNVCELYKDT